MCRAVTCRKCGKATWSGCGSHVNQVMAGIPRDQRCDGHTGEDADGSEGGFLARFLSRF